MLILANLKIFTMNRIFSTAIFLFALVAVMPRAAQGQLLIDSLISPNEESFGWFGYSVAGIGGDVNADGVPDVIVGASGEDPGSSPLRAGRAYIISGATGNVLDTLVSPNEIHLGQFGHSVAGIGGDVNADGVPDVIVGAFSESPGGSPIAAGRAYIISGATGNVLDTLVSPNEENNGSFGWSVAGTGGDVNADGVPDVIVGAIREDPGSSPSDAGRAYIISGATGNVLHTLQSPNERFRGVFGRSVAGTGGDVNADGVSDVIVGAHQESPGSSPSDAGRAYIISGATGNVLHTLQSPNEEFRGGFGWSVTGIGGDVNADGTPDVVVGAIYEGPGNSPFGAGRAYIISGATGNVLDTLVSPNEEGRGSFGFSVAGIGGDVNADAVPDVIVGARGEDPGSSPLNAGRAYIINGATGNVLDTLVSPNDQYKGLFGFSVAGIGGDVNADWVPDVIVGAYKEDSGSFSNEGRAYLFNGRNIPCAAPANINSFTFNGHTYQIVKEQKSWSAAASCAVSLGGYLAEINSQAEQDSIYNSIQNLAGISSIYTSVPDGGGVAYVWLGDTDLQTEGTWLWDGDNDNTGTNFWNGQGSAGNGGGTAAGGSYVNWGGASSGSPNEPDNFNNQDAAAIGLSGWPSSNPGFLGNAGEWNDIDTSNQLYYVVEQNCTDTTITQTLQACDSLTWINGITYTSDNDSATVTLQTVNGCDSMITLDLTINSNTGTDVITVCDSFTWIDGVTYTSSNNTATDTLSNAVGCDSVITLDLTINSNTGTDVITVCDSITWIDGVTYTSSNNTATDTLTNAAGCDSVVTLALTINNNTSTDVITACDSYVWIDGITYTSSNNTATNTLTNAAGCDSVVTLNLTINNPTTGTDVINACGSFTWIDGITYTSSNNTATDTLISSAGCDSVVTLNLTINNSTTGTDIVTACDSFTWIDGVTYTSSNNSATHTLTNAVGCDSVVTLVLTINNSNTVTDVITACNSFTWIDGVTYTSSNNTATDTLINAAGCDSVVTLDLTINSTTGTDVVTACNSFTWIDGITYNSSNNTATDTLINAAGCDSVVTLDLTINNSTTGTDVVTACDSYVWIDGVTYTSSNNTATDTLTNAAGCDSVVTLDLTINNSTTGTDVITACDSYTWIDGITYTSSNNTATDTLTNAVGCDSVVTLDLTINLSTSSRQAITACDSFTWIDGITYTASNNTATDTLTNAVGCDSVVTLDLTINNPDTSVSRNGIELTAQETAATYQWLDCNNAFSPIAGATARVFTPVNNGNYAVEISKNNCTDTSGCYAINSVGLNSFTEGSLKVYPNPTESVLMVELNRVYFPATLEITDARGKIMSAKTVHNPKEEALRLDVSSLAAGLYFLRVSWENQRTEVKKFIKE